MQVGERQALDESESGGVIGFGLAGEAGDDIGADGGVGKTFTDQFDAAGIVFRTVPAVHGGEYAVGAGLQRHVEVLGEAFGRGEEFDQVPGDIERLDGADAEALDGSLGEDAADEIEKFGAGREVAAVGAQVDTAEDDFAETASGEALDLLENGFDGEAAALAANERNHAVRTAAVAAVLNFERGPAVIPFPAENRRGQEGSLFEDVAGENLGRSTRKG